MSEKYDKRRQVRLEPKLEKRVEEYRRKLMPPASWPVTINYLVSHGLNHIKCSLERK